MNIRLKHLVFQLQHSIKVIFKNRQLLSFLRYNFSILISRFFIFFPIKENRILFIAYGGNQFSCNPKYLYKYISKNHTRYECIWAFSSPELLADFKEKEKPAVKILSLRFFYLICTSKFIIDNNHFMSGYPARKEQVYIQTWHGGGAYKKVGVSAFMKDQYKLIKKAKKIDYYVASCEKFIEVQSLSNFIEPNKFIKTGMPRNSFILNGDETIIDNVYKYLKINRDVKLVLYAPTYRGQIEDSLLGQHTEFLQELDYSKLIENLDKKFGGQWKLLVRTHRFTSNDLSNYGKDSILDVSKYSDMQELLLAADILITDYSSSMWDFSLTKKPAFLYCPDIDRYISNDRNFYTSPSEWPYEIATSNDELTALIQAYDSERSERKIKGHLDQLGFYENINSSKLICDIVGIN